ncbi:MAG: S8 family serine peptidase [Verrucomicrobiota bacterium]
MRKWVIGLAAACLAVGITTAGASAAPKAFEASSAGRYIVIAPNKASFNTALTAAQASGRIALNLAPVNALAINASPGVAQTIARLSGAKVVPDRIESLVRPGMYAEAGWNDPAKVSPAMIVNRLAAMKRAQNPLATSMPGGSPFDIAFGFTPDPAFGLGPPDPMWSIERIGGPTAWTTNGGDNDVLVAVADTGLDYSHEELDSQVVGVADFTTTELPQICKDIFGYGFGDADIAASIPAPADLDYNGHGTWIGGNIAAEVNSNSVNGLAPGVSLVSLKISQWCGSAFDSEIMASFVWAAEHGVDVVSISFGGYLDRHDFYQAAIYDLYGSVVKYAWKFGTTIVAAAGNEHARIGSRGKVLSHGILSTPPGGDDFFGLYEVPGGLSNVVDVSSTGNVVNAPSATCPTAYSTDGAHPYCKPTTDAHQPFGVGMQNQLAYYSNYGPRIDVAAPGGARKFNLPAVDRGGTEGWPFTGMDSYASDNDPGAGESSVDGFNAWEDFSITSNFALEIPCVIFDGSSADPTPDGYFGVPTQTGFDTDQCYSSIQGTSMATPHASATLGLIVSAFPGLRYYPSKLVKVLKATVTPTKTLKNTTPPLSSTDTSDTDLTGLSCPDGFCHLGGKAIKPSEAFGSGIVNAANAVAGGISGP